MGLFQKRSEKRADLASRAEELFGVKGEAAGPVGVTGLCAQVYRGRPPWRDKEQGVETVNFAKSVCAELARLATLAVKVTVSGSERAAWLQEQVDGFYFRLRQWTELGCAWGTVILKPSGEGVDVLTPEQFLITQTRGDAVTGAVFESGRWDGERYYTRLEYHRFLADGRYAISNRCFVGDGPYDRGRPVAMEATPWAGLAADVTAEGLIGPLFAVLRMPGANHLAPGSALGLPVFAEALRELEDLDVAYSRFVQEVYESQRICLIDDRLTDQTGPGPGLGQAVKLPRFVRRVFGAGPEEYYQAIDPSLHTEERLAGIRALLGQIGFKCGFSNGYFVFNERSGLMTATQVVADDRRTVQLVKDVRDRLEEALDGLLYALDRTADAMGLAPEGAYQAVYDFGDVTYNREEDRARWYGYVADGRLPFWYYLMKFEGYSEQEAKALAAAGGKENGEDGT